MSICAGSDSRLERLGRCTIPVFEGVPKGNHDLRIVPRRGDFLAVTVNLQRTKELSGSDQEEVFLGAQLKEGPTVIMRVRRPAPHLLV